MERKLKIMENEKHTLSDLGYGKKHSKTRKMRNAHCGTWNIARKLKNVEKKRHKHCLNWNIAKNTQKHGK
jgi:hypothetical protein